MINKHSTNREGVQIPSTVRVAKVVSSGNGTVDVSPIGSSVVLHDIPVSGSSNLQAGDIVYLQMIDNKRMAFAEYTPPSQETTVIYTSSGSTFAASPSSGAMEVHSMSGPFHTGEIVPLQATWAALKSTTAVAGSGLTGGGTLGSSFTFGVATATGTGLAISGNVLRVNLSGTSGLNTTSGLAVGQGNGISIGTSSVAVDQAYPFVWSSAHTFSGGINVGSATGAAAGEVRASMLLLAGATQGDQGQIRTSAAYVNSDFRGLTIANTGNAGLTLQTASISLLGVNESARLVGGNQNSGDGAPGFFAVWTRANSTTIEERLRINSAGNVGIGIAAPVATASRFVHLSGTTSELHLTSDFSGHVQSDGLSIQMWSDGIAYFIQRENAAMEFWTNNTKRVVIDSAGRLGIGNFPPSHSLDVSGDIRASGNLGVRGGGVTGAAVEAWGAVNALPAATGSSAEAAFRASGGGTNAILDVGTSGATGVAWLQARNRTNYATNYSILINPNGGNLGVNRADPSYPLDVSGSVRFTGGLNVGTTGASTGEIVASSNISGASGAFTGGLNVGIASSAATGEIRTSSASNPRIVIESTGSTSFSRSFLRFSGATVGDFMSIGYYPDASPRRMHINYNSESASLPIMSLTSTNRVGINTQTPSYTLDVSGDVRASGAINVGTAAGTTAGYLYVSGRIGVGKNAADYPLDVVGDIYSSASVRANTSVITQELTGAGASTSVSLTNGTGFKSSQYVSGFAGNGWRIYRQNDSTKAEWEVDNLTVRGTLSVYELLIQQIRATNGSIFVSAAAKIESVSGTGPYTLIVEGGSSDYAPFAVGDVIRAQRVSLGTSTLVWQSDLTVTGTNSVVNGTANPRAFTATLRSGSTAPAAGMEYVRLGNTTDAGRQGAVYLTADDTGAPFIDIVDGIASHADWGTAGKIKSRIGRLNGILGGATANYGIWSGTGTSNADSWVKMAEDGILLNNVPLKMYSGGNQTVDFAASGNLKIGTNVANTSTTALNWDGTTLSIKGNITVTGGDAETTSGAQSKANTAQSTAQTYSDTELAKVVNKSTGKLAFSFATAPTGSGLYLGSTHLGYFNGVWKTYMNSTGQFYLSGTGNQGLTWDGATLSIDGDLTARSGSFEGYVTIGTGGGLYQGTGTGASPTSGLRIRSNNGLGSVELWSGSVVRGVFGNLRSLYDYAASDLYGAAIGPYVNSTSHITIEPTNGIRMRNRASDGTVYQVFRVDNSGTMTVGRTDSEYISVDTTNGIRMLDATSTKFQVNASGEVYIGDTSGSNNNVQITSTELNIRRGTQKMLSLTGTSMTINNSAGSAVITMNNSGGASFSNTITVGTEIGIVPGANPYIAIGGTAYPTGFLAASTTGIWMGSENNLPKMRIGTTNASGVLTSGMQWDGSSLTVNGAITAQSGSIEGILSIGANGELRQGAGTFGTNFTGLRIWTDGWNSTYTFTVTATGGTFTMSYGGATTSSIAFGATATTLQSALVSLSSIGAGNATVTKASNVFTIVLNQSLAGSYGTLTANTGSLTGGTGTLAATVVTQIGRLAGYNNNSLQWYANADGRLYAAGGNATIDANGFTAISGNAASAANRSYKFYSASAPGADYYLGNYADSLSGTVELRAWGYNSSRTETVSIFASNQNGGLTTGTKSSIDLSADSSTGTISMIAGKGSGQFSVNAGLALFQAGLNVGADNSGVVVYPPYQTSSEGELRVLKTGHFGNTTSGTNYLPTSLNWTANTTLLLNSTQQTSIGFQHSGNGVGFIVYSYGQLELGYNGGSGYADVLMSGNLGSAYSGGSWILFSGTFNTNWAHFETTETTWSSVRYKRVGDFVFLKGLIKRTAGTGLSTTAFTLPANYRPAKRTMFFQASRPAGQTGTVGIRVDVLADGTVNAADIGTTAGYDFISLDGIFFSTTLAGSGGPYNYPAA